MIALDSVGTPSESVAVLEFAVKGRRKIHFKVKSRCRRLTKAITHEVLGAYRVEHFNIPR